jgi:hypothetical protein
LLSQCGNREEKREDDAEDETPRQKHVGLLLARRIAPALTPALSKHV